MLRRPALLRAVARQHGRALSVVATNRSQQHAWIPAVVAAVGGATALVGSVAYSECKAQRPAIASKYKYVIIGGGARESAAS